MKTIYLPILAILLSACGKPSHPGAACPSNLPGTWLDQYRGTLTIQNDCSAVISECSSPMRLAVSGDAVTIEVLSHGAQPYCLAQGAYDCKRLPSNDTDLYIDCGGTTYQWARAQ